jgi:signal transduction histidine kinase
MGQRPFIVNVLNVGVLAALPLLLVALVVAWRDVQEKGRQVAAEHVHRAQVAALSVDAFIGANIAAVHSLAISLSPFDPSSGAEVTATLDRVVSENPFWLGVALVGPDGWDLGTASPPNAQRVYIGDRPYFQQVMATGQPTVSDGIVGRVNNVPTVVLASPLSLSSGERGVLVAPFPIMQLAATLRPQVETGTARIVLVDRLGQTIVSPDPDQVAYLAPLMEYPAVSAVLAGESGHRIAEWNGVECLIAFAPVTVSGWGVLLVEPTAAAFASARQDALHDVALIAASLVMVVGIATFFQRRLAASFRREADARLQAEAARTEADAARHRATFLANAGARLAAAVDYERTLTALAELTVPALADWCLVDVVDEQGRLQRHGLAHDAMLHGAVQAEVTHLAWRLPEVPEEIAEVLRSGQGRISERAADVLLAGGSAAQRRQLAEELALSSAIIVPLVARDRVLGTLTLIMADSRRRFGPDDLAFANLLADRAALVIANAQLYREVQQAVLLRDEFLAVASHDLRSPLASIGLAAEALQLRIQAEPLAASNELATVLADIEAACRRMDDLIGSLLDVAQLQMGHPLRLQRASTDLVLLVAQVVAEYQERTKRSAIAFDASQPVSGEWDAARLRRVVENLLDNAVKYSPGGGEIHVALLRDDTGPAAAAVLTVEDAGIGIPPEDLPYIFERFRRGSNVLGRVPGTGIGLAGARQIIEQHGGTIAVASEIGCGTRFTIRLPLASGAQDLPDPMGTAPA